MEHDPIPMYHQRLLRLGVAEERLAEIVTSVAAAIGATTEEAKAAAPPTRPSCGRTSGPTGGGSGAADLPRGGLARHRPGAS